MEESIILFVSTNPESIASEIAAKVIGEGSRPSEINPTLYSMARKKILTFTKDGGAPKWSLSPAYGLKEPILVFLSSGEKVKSRTIFAAFKPTEKSVVNSVLYSLQAEGKITVEKDAEGKNPVWSIV